MKQNANAPKLEPTLGLITVVLLVISAIIGSGVFKKVAPMSEALGSPSLVLLCWFLAGLVTLMGALTNAEVAGLIADSGGQYVYFKRMYGKFFAFLYGWASFSVIQCATIASVAYVFAGSVHSIWPLPELSADWQNIQFLKYTTADGDVAYVFSPFKDAGIKVLTIGLITLLSVVNYRGVKYGGFIANILASTVVIAIFGLAIAGLASAAGSVDNLNETVDTEAVNTSLFSALFAAMLSAFWAYEGWNSIGFIGAEVKNPKRNIPLALTFGVILVMFTYLTINFVYLYVSPVSEIIANKAADPNSIAAVGVAEKIMGSYGGLAIAILIIVATFNCTNSTILTAPRVFFAMAKDGLFFRSVAKVHPKFHTPSTAIVFGAVWSSILVLSGNFDQLTDMLIFAAFIFYGAGAFGVFVLRRKMKDAPRPYKVIGYPVVPLLFIIFCAVLVVNTCIEMPREAGMGLVLIAAGIPFYYFWNKRAIAEGVTGDDGNDLAAGQ